MMRNIEVGYKSLDIEIVPQVGERLLENIGRDKDQEIDNTYSSYIKALKLE